MRLDRDGVRLAGVDFGGEGPGALLLHGLAGHAGEWAATARWLTRRCRVVAFDARGHGRSERLPADVSRAAHVADGHALAQRGQRVQVVDLPDAEHDLHLDAPDEWRAVVSRFLDALDAA